MSCADACVTMDYDGTCEFWQESTPRARKEYRCVECGAVIAVGDVHHRVAGKFEGDFFTERTCLPCHEIRTVFVCDGVALGVLWESIRDQLFWKWNEMFAIDCLARLTSDAAIEKMRKHYAEYQEDR